ncbi:hypothetical protein B296_00035674 [Ensete ventricosum]|uniref:Uncharacterized protein n=1 Tax=Ensete ventricosum TaxID=4639 RepID=A0A426YQB9_ENSVE|nr:hypothetical protein B296_00035674 [Ensete ventricosum]
MGLAASWYCRGRGAVPFLLRGVGDKDDGEDGIIPEATKTIIDLLQVCSFWAKLLAFRKFDGSEKVNYHS